MRSLIAATLLGFALALASPVGGWASPVSHVAGVRGYVHTGVPSPITLRVSTGYDNIYRDTAWTPVHVTLHNSSSADISGALEIPQSSRGSSVGPSQLFHGLYQVPVTIPAGGTKRVTVYVPGAGVQDLTRATFWQGNRTLATGSTYPMGIDSSSLLIGVLSGSPASAAWLNQASQRQATAHIIHLTAASLDPVPQALSTFDIIVLDDVDTSQLDRAQFTALDQYVRSGGSLIVVGGLHWQETLRPLPGSLLPGRMISTRTLPDLHSVLALASLPDPSGRQVAVVSVLAHPGGSVLAEQSGIPLLVRKMMGNGVVEYIAFDPALDPVQSWSGAPALLGRLVSASAPGAIARTFAPQGFRSRFLRAFTSMSITNELGNVPPSTPPLLALFAVLTLGYVLLLGPANFLILRRLNRQHLAWITIPVLAFSYLGSTFGITTHFRGSAVLLNSVGFIALDGNTGPHPATFYVGLIAPQPGDYHLTYAAPALAAPLAQLTQVDGPWWRTGPPPSDNPLGMRLQSGAQTAVTFLSMKTWAIRDTTLQTTVNIPGKMQTDLHVDVRGNIVGPIHNGTNLTLQDPIIVAGQTISHLPDISAGSTTRIRVQPTSDVSTPDQLSVWNHLYGGSGLSDGEGFFRGFDDGQQSSPSQEKTLAVRAQNVASMMAQAQPLSTVGEVALVGWTEQPLGSFKVDGRIPQQRALNLVVMPLTVNFPSSGPFRLSTGTVAAHLVDIVPRVPASTCCNFSGDSGQLSVGPGGSFTLQFQMPQAHHVRFTHLFLNVNSSADSFGASSVYNWQTHGWVRVDLSNGATLRDPMHFVSPTGRLLVRLQSTVTSGDISIGNPYQDIQVSGSGTVN